MAIAGACATLAAAGYSVTQQLYLLRSGHIRDLDTLHWICDSFTARVLRLDRAVSALTLADVVTALQDAKLGNGSNQPAESVERPLPLHRLTGN